MQLYDVGQSWPATLEPERQREVPKRRLFSFDLLPHQISFVASQRTHLWSTRTG